jgi:hypothetical protein
VVWGPWEEVHRLLNHDQDKDKEGKGGCALCSLGLSQHLVASSAKGQTETQQG